jgi:RNA polymerase sigma-70 factor (ECF subfamily)
MLSFLVSVGSGLVEKSDNELMSEFAACSKEAYEVIFKRYKKPLKNYAWGILKDYDLSEEVVQKALIKVWKYKYRYKPRYKFITWVFTITKNLCINELRYIKRELNRKGETEVDNLADNDSVDANKKIEEEQNSQNLKELISHIPVKYSQIIYLRYLEELSFKEISSRTGLNENTLKSLAKRALEKLKTEVEKNKIGKEKIHS